MFWLTGAFSAISACLETISNDVKMPEMRENKKYERLLHIGILYEGHS